MLVAKMYLGNCIQIFTLVNCFNVIVTVTELILIFSHNFMTLVVVVAK